MSTKSKVTSPRRKTKLVPKPQVIQLTSEMIDAHEREQARMYIQNHWDFATPAERKVVRHLNVLAYGGVVGLVKEIRRLLGESIAACKIIPFPIARARKSKSAAEA